MWRLAPRTDRVVVVVKGPEWTWEEASGCVFLRVCVSSCQLGVLSESEERRCEKAEMKMFSPIGIAARESGAPESPDACHYHYKSARLSLSEQSQTPTSLTHPSPPSTPTSDKDVPLFPVRPPNAPPPRTNNPPEAQLVPSPPSKGRRYLSPPRPLLPILLCIFLPNLSICRHRRQSPRPRLSPLSCSRRSP
jgi:hypothetical protein